MKPRRGRRETRPRGDVLPGGFFSDHSRRPGDTVKRNQLLGSASGMVIKSAPGGGAFVPGSGGTLSAPVRWEKGLGPRLETGDMNSVSSQSSTVSSVDHASNLGNGDFFGCYTSICRQIQHLTISGFSPLPVASPLFLPSCASRSLAWLAYMSGMVHRAGCVSPSAPDSNVHVKQPQPPKHRSCFVASQSWPVFSPSAADLPGRRESQAFVGRSFYPCEKESAEIIPGRENNPPWAKEVVKA